MLPLQCHAQEGCLQNSDGRTDLVAEGLTYPGGLVFQENVVALWRGGEVCVN